MALTNAAILSRAEAAAPNVLRRMTWALLPLQNVPSHQQGHARAHLELVDLVCPSVALALGCCTRAQICRPARTVEMVIVTPTTISGTGSHPTAEPGMKMSHTSMTSCVCRWELDCVDGCFSVLCSADFWSGLGLGVLSVEAKDRGCSA